MTLSPPGRAQQAKSVERNHGATRRPLHRRGFLPGPRGKRRHGGGADGGRHRGRDGSHDRVCTYRPSPPMSCGPSPKSRVPGPTTGTGRRSSSWSPTGRSGPRMLRSAVQDSLHPARDVPADPRCAHIAQAGRVGRLAEAFHAQPRPATVHAQVDRHQLTLRDRTCERAIGLDHQLARGRAGVGEHLSKRPRHEHGMRDGQQLPRRRLAGNRIALRQPHPHRTECTALNTHTSQAARRVRQPRNPTAADHSCKWPARSRVAVHEASKPGNSARSKGYPRAQGTTLPLAMKSCRLGGTVILS